MDLEAFRPAVRVVDDRKQRWRTDGFEATDPLPVVSRGVPAGADAPVTSQPLGGGLRPHVAVRWPSAMPANDGHPGVPGKEPRIPDEGSFPSPSRSWSVGQLPSRPKRSRAE